MTPVEKREYLATKCREWLEAALRDGLPEDPETLFRLGRAIAWAGEVRVDKPASRCSEATWRCAWQLRRVGLDRGIPAVTMVAERHRPSMTTLLDILPTYDLLDAHPV